jgi:hypothetical protein
MVGTTRLELATSPTPIPETTQSDNLAKPIYTLTTRRNAFWTRNGPIDGPTLVAHAIDSVARTATSKGPHLALGGWSRDRQYSGDGARAYSL